MVCASGAWSEVPHANPLPNQHGAASVNLPSPQCAIGAGAAHGRADLSGVRTVLDAGVFVVWSETSLLLLLNGVLRRGSAG